MNNFKQEKENNVRLPCRLNPALPDLKDEKGNPVNFRRALLNKCQEEFDFGVNAMKAVAEREKRAQDDKVRLSINCSSLRLRIRGHTRISMSRRKASQKAK